MIEPPDVIDFAGTYDQWTEKQRQAKPGTAIKKSQPAKASAPKPSTPPPKASTPAPQKKKDNPYARPFGRMSVPEIEQKLKSTERELNAAQQKAADPQLFRNPGKARAAADEVARAGQGDRGP